MKKYDLLKVLRRQDFRWWLIGMTFLGMGLGATYLFVDVLGLPVIWGTLFSLLLGAIFRFFAIDKWVFQKKPEGTTLRFIKYQISHAASYAVGWGLINLFVMVGIHYLLASILATAVTTLVTMASHFQWVWKPQKRWVESDRYL
jgi:putative flippase GtrA